MSNLLRNYGPPGASSNGFNENLALFSTGHCAMWIDATVAAGFVSDPKNSQVADKVGFAPAPIAKVPNGTHWFWAWALAVPKSSHKAAVAKSFLQWATSADYIKLVATDQWLAAGAARHAAIHLRQLRSTWPRRRSRNRWRTRSRPPTLQHPTAQPVPYTGIQYVAIPEFQAIGTTVGQLMAGALTGQSTRGRDAEAGAGAGDVGDAAGRLHPVAGRNAAGHVSPAGRHAPALRSGRCAGAARQRRRGRHAAAGRTFGGAAAAVVARAAGDDAVVLVPALQSAEPDDPRLRRMEQLHVTCSSDPALLSSLVVTVVLVGAVLIITVGFGAVLAAVFETELSGPRHRAGADDLAVLRHADGQRADLEEPADESGERAVRADCARLGLRRWTGSPTLRSARSS